MDNLAPYLSTWPGVGVLLTLGWCAGIMWWATQRKRRVDDVMRQ